MTLQISRDSRGEDFFGDQYFQVILGDLFVTVSSIKAEMTFSIFLRGASAREPPFVRH